MWGPREGETLVITVVMASWARGWRRGRGSVETTTPRHLVGLLFSLSFSREPGLGSLIRCSLFFSTRPRLGPRGLGRRSPASQCLAPVTRHTLSTRPSFLSRSVLLPRSFHLYPRFRYVTPSCPFLKVNCKNIIILSIETQHFG
jgi:hypothetical protein